MGLFDGLSEALFLDRSQSQRLRTAVCRYLLTHHKRDMPESLKFLDSLPGFASHYAANQEANFFEPVTLQTVSELFEKAVIVYTVIEKNQVLLSSIYNNGFASKCHLLAYPVGNQFSFNAVFPSFEIQHLNSNLSKDDQLRELTFVRKVTSNDGSEEEVAQVNLALLESKLKELDGEVFEKGTVTATDTAAETNAHYDPNVYAKYISSYLSPVSLLELSLQKLKENEVIWYLT